MEPIFILLGIAAFSIVMGIIIHNGIIHRRNMVVRAWADVITYERQKNVTLPELERHAKDYGAHEKSLLSNIAALRSAISGASTTEVNADDLAKIERSTETMMAGFRIAVEAYPDLKQADVTLRLMREISELQDNIAAAISIFNGNVEAFNTGIQTFPNSLVNGMVAKETPYKSFQNEDAATSLGFSLQRED